MFNTFLFYRGVPKDPNVGYFYVANARNEQQYIEAIPDPTAPVEIQGKSFGVIYINITKYLSSTAKM